MKIETVFLRIAIFFFGILVIVLGVLGSSLLVRATAYYQFFYVLSGIYLCVIPFMIALYQAFRLLNYIDKNKAFSDLSVKAIKYIKYCAFVVSILLTACLPFIYLIAESEDAPGLILIWAAICAVPFIIAVFIAVLQKLLKNAIEIKSDNDLTI